MAEEKYSIQVLERAFSIMDVLLQAGEPLSLEIIMTRTGLAKSTAFRLISNLVRYGYVAETDNGYWLLAWAEDDQLWAGCCEQS